MPGNSSVLRAFGTVPLFRGGKLKDHKANFDLSTCVSLGLRGNNGTHSLIEFQFWNFLLLYYAIKSWNFNLQLRKRRSARPIHFDINTVKEYLHEIQSYLVVIRKMSPVAVAAGDICRNTGRFTDYGTSE